MLLGFVFSCVALRARGNTRISNLRLARQKERRRHLSRSQQNLMNGEERDEEEENEIDILMLNDHSALGDGIKQTRMRGSDGKDNLLNILHEPLEGESSRTSIPQTSLTTTKRL